MTSLYTLRCITKDFTSLVHSNSLIPVISSPGNSLFVIQKSTFWVICVQESSVGLPLGWSVFPIAELVPIITHLCFSFPQIKGSTFTENHPSTNSMVKPAFPRV